MTYQDDFTLPAALLEQITAEGLDVLPELIRIVINTAMHAERQQYLQAGPYERTPQRRDYANGYKPKTVHTRVGQIAFAVPQVRAGQFYPDALEKGLRSERALTLALAEMYVQGVSTRKVDALVKALGLTGIDKSKVSRICKELDQAVDEFRIRKLQPSYPYVWLDGGAVPQSAAEPPHRHLGAGDCCGRG